MRPIRRRNISETAADMLRAQVSGGKWPIGTRLPNESVLADTLAVSRGTIREAVRVLVSEGVLETRQGSGTFVCSPAAAPFEKNLRHYSQRDKQEVLDAIYRQAIRLAARRSTPSQIEEIRSALVKQHRSESDPADRDHGTADFHRRLVSSSGNKMLIDLYVSLAAALRNDHEPVVSESWMLIDRNASLSSLLNSIEARDTDSALAVVEQVIDK
ncbi:MULTISPECIES: GntR family transcriptional regulator [unclassified Rhizobium]|uniref:FadR/GntR family transcriptional regulator n=1 Tax=unclassified Rhizobium TaxID=2613769 RepID=UPI000EA8B361|nr:MULTISPECIES: GntR family transcriptional regulator [unclassified Rhizobium]AYG67493.1 FadR family transcriptional regulator [Rhizobium sp. CCGE531]AYG73887.1 FadR family transcriptional regulator [Rhizobium sp. CCGE532]